MFETLQALLQNAAFFSGANTASFPADGNGFHGNYGAADLLGVAIGQMIGLGNTQQPDNGTATTIAAAFALGANAAMAGAPAARKVETSAIVERLRPMILNFALEATPWQAITLVNGATAPQAAQPPMARLVGGKLVQLRGVIGVPTAALGVVYATMPAGMTPTRWYGLDCPAGGFSGGFQRLFIGPPGMTGGSNAGTQLLDRQIYAVA